PEGRSEQAHAAVEVEPEGARAHDAVAGVGRDDAPHREPVALMDVGHRHRGPHDPGQGRAVSDLVERRVGANRLDQAVVGDDEGRDAHATALVLGNPPEIRVDSLEAHIIDSLASARRAPAPRPPSSAPEALSWWPAIRWRGGSSRPFPPPR